MKQLENVKLATLIHAKAFFAIVLGILAVIGFIGWWKGDQWRTSYADTAIVHGIYLTIVLYLLWIILNNRSPDYLGLPTVKSVRDNALLIVEGAPWLSLSVMTAVYVKEDEFERLVCVGEVINVQANKLVQIKIRGADTAFETVEAAAMKLSAVAKDAILIRPGLYGRLGE
ncbi:hypothetical protein [Rhizobium laguerreae]|uniref:hypothetical protein n=1 Tax=Rhizobium laguerreae TaxID=1076926 RepID=UPI00300A3507